MSRIKCVFIRTLFQLTNRQTPTALIRQPVHTSTPLHKKMPLKGKKMAAQKWLVRQASDPYVRDAQGMNYRCRSAFKLLEMDEKQGFLKPGSVVVDCGAAPGSWTQVAVDRVNALGTSPKLPKGKVLAVDLLGIVPVPGATILERADFTAQTTQDALRQELDHRGVDVVLSDMAPNATGMKAMDHENIVRLSGSALQFATSVLRPGGSFICKIWQGALQKDLEAVLRKYFSNAKVIKPKASRSDSAEVFLLATHFKGKQSTK